MKRGDELTVFADGEKIDVWSEKNIHSSNKFVNFRPIEIPKTEIEYFVWERKYFQLRIGIFLDPFEVAIVLLPEGI